MAYLLDTNVISEFRKGSRANRGVTHFFATTDSNALFLPVQVVGEIRAGVAKALICGRTDEAKAYDRWLDMLVANYGSRIIGFDIDCAQMWGTLLSHDKKDPDTIDKQIAAIALISDLTVVTRDKGKAFTGTPNLKVYNPFSDTP